MDVPKLIYLDVCVLCRPFDDQKYLRIRMEIDAVNLILANIRKNKYKLAISPVHIFEINAIPEIYERIHIRTILDELGELIKIDITDTRQRAEELVQKGFGVADAAHIAFAEKSNITFITCDDLLLKKCLRNKIGIWCTNPIAFCEKEGLR